MTTSVSPPTFLPAEASGCFASTTVAAASASFVVANAVAPTAGAFFAAPVALAPPPPPPPKNEAMPRCLLSGVTLGGAISTKWLLEKDKEKKTNEKWKATRLLRKTKKNDALFFRPPTSNNNKKLIESSSNNISNNSPYLPFNASPDRKKKTTATAITSCTRAASP